MATEPATAFDKIWNAHLVARLDDGRDLVFVDRHVLQETTSAIAFAGLKRSDRPVRHPELTIATQDHVVSTRPGRDEDSYAGGRELMMLMRANAYASRVQHFGIDDPRQGIVHVIAPELGFALPGSILACGDSHTSTVGGLGALGIGVGTSEVEHVLATQTLALTRPRNMRVRFEGKAGTGIFAKDLILRAMGELGVAGGRGCAVEYAGPAIEALSVESRLTVCNMSIELGARLGLIAPDEKTFAYVKGREFAPTGEAYERAVQRWRTLRSDQGAPFERDVLIDCDSIAPQVTWGTTPEHVAGVSEHVPDPATLPDARRRDSIAQALNYMGLEPGTPLKGIPIDVAFIGSCTNSRISDLEAAAYVVKGRKVSPNVRGLVVPGSMSVKREAEARGLDQIFRAAGFEWREAGCSMCVSINDDVVAPGSRCIATSNRNFENRQGPRSRTHLASPVMVAAAALAGHITDIREDLVQ
ncbi:3-isopropylmalate dehydratase large subunit [Starkeya sp. ORNL1]|uniref:3-isopropylmalate dehydratase large subunit n=1 Tax=Starkeya sp. ORNL1 TaxID=2709380 RepID=UPI001463027A|nr:3-isopropylmalate dehydratase large subunit [Starkeya sp. ORNL1]QJP16095.1 3-isopropylmalate dehydratase large subunit [Starkeya sp. ORNL1]